MIPSNVHPSAVESHAADDGSYHAHVTPLPIYFAVFGALLVLTVITVGISELGLPQPWSLLAALAVAVLKATLVCAFFMHLFFEVKSYTFVLLAGVFFSGIFFTLTMTDLLTRGDVIPEPGNRVMFDEATAQGKDPNGWRTAKPGAGEHDAHGGAEHGEPAPAAHQTEVAPAEGQAPSAEAPAAH